MLQVDFIDFERRHVASKPSSGQIILASTDLAFRKRVQAIQHNVAQPGASPWKGWRAECIARQVTTGWETTCSSCNCLLPLLIRWYSNPSDTSSQSRFRWCSSAWAPKAGRSVTICPTSASSSSISAKPSGWGILSPPSLRNRRSSLLRSSMTCRPKRDLHCQAVASQQCATNVGRWLPRPKGFAMDASIASMVTQRPSMRMAVPVGAHHSSRSSSSKPASTAATVVDIVWWCQVDFALTVRGAPMATLEPVSTVARMSRMPISEARKTAEKDRF